MHLKGCRAARNRSGEWDHPSPAMRQAFHWSSSVLLQFYSPFWLDQAATEFAADALPDFLSMVTFADSSAFLTSLMSPHFSSFAARILVAHGLWLHPPSTTTHNPFDDSLISLKSD